MLAPARVTRPYLLIIAGPNGVGKSTAYTDIQGDFDVILDADKVAASLHDQDKPTREFAAGRLIVMHLSEAIQTKRNILIESTLSGKWLSRHLSHAISLGYRVDIWYVWVESVEITIKRIEGRVQAGGHLIPEDVVRRRFPRGIRNFFQIYLPLAHSWNIVDNTSQLTTLVAFGTSGKETVVEQKTWNQLRRFIIDVSHEAK